MIFKLVVLFTILAFASAGVIETKPTVPHPVHQMPGATATAVSYQSFSRTFHPTKPASHGHAAHVAPVLTRPVLAHPTQIVQPGALPYGYHNGHPYNLPYGHNYEFPGYGLAAPLPIYGNGHIGAPVLGAPAYDYGAPLGHIAYGQYAY